MQEAPIAKTNVEKFDRMMRKVDPEWPGIKGEGFREYIDNLKGGIIKSYMADRMALVSGRIRAFQALQPYVTPCRSQPLSMRHATLPAWRFHNTLPVRDCWKQWTGYPKGVAGQHMGQLASLLPFDVAAPTIAKGLGRVNAANFAAGQRGCHYPTLPS